MPPRSCSVDGVGRICGRGGRGAARRHAGAREQEKGNELDALLSAVVEATTRPLLVLTADLRVTHASPAFLESASAPPPAVLGHPLFEIDGGRWNMPELRRLLAQVTDAGARVRASLRAPGAGGDGKRWIVVDARLLPAAGGREETILLAMTHVSESDISGDNPLAESLADALLGSVREAVLVLRPDLTVLRVNDAFCDSFQVASAATLDRPVYEIGDGAWDLPPLHHLLEEALPRQGAVDDFEIDHAFPRLGRRILSLSARRLEHVPLILLTIRDLTEAQQVEVRQKNLVGELQHRVKNILANVSALTRQTRRQATTLQDFVEAFEGRLSALARTQDLLVSGPSGSAELGTLVRSELLALGAREGQGLRVSGPVLPLPSRQAQVLGMVIHELATNALRHGALASESGSVEVSWSQDRKRAAEGEAPAGASAVADGGPEVELVWREHGVELAPDPLPEGFGTQLIERSAPYMLRGSSSLTARPDGIECRISFSLAGP